MAQFHRIAALSIMILTALASCDSYAKPETNNQPLANIDKLIRQANGTVKLDNLLDPKLAANITSVFNEISLNLNKMMVENKRLSSQIQEVVQRVQNSTNLNATAAFVNKVQQQYPNTPSFNPMNTSLTNINDMIPKIQPSKLLNN